jgi:hypothetical protein
MQTTFFYFLVIFLTQEICLCFDKTIGNMEFAGIDIHTNLKKVLLRFIENVRICSLIFFKYAFGNKKYK